MAHNAADARPPGKLLALIPARGGSKGLPGKNLLPANDKPLIAWTITAAQQSKSVDYLVISSDDEDIIETARQWDCAAPFRRPAELATDVASSMDVVLHALDQLPGYDYVALLQPTSPLRTAGDIDAAFAKLVNSGAPSCVSVCLTEESPYWMYALNDAGHLISLLPAPDNITRRQDLPPTYMLNGAIYIARIEWLRKTRSFVADGCVAYVMPVERSIDIDTIDDFDAFCRKVGSEKQSAA